MTLPQENWTEGHKPGNVTYFAGPMKDAKVIPLPEDHTFPEMEHKRLRGIAKGTFIGMKERQNMDLEVQVIAIILNHVTDLKIRSKMVVK